LTSWTQSQIECQAKLNLTAEKIAGWSQDIIFDTYVAVLLSVFQSFA
jgi:hypothetical protein